MSNKWVVKVESGEAKGEYGMPSKREAEEFLSAWRADQNGRSASATIYSPSGNVHIRLVTGFGF